MKNYFKFWGTRGSCPVSGLEYSHFGGNTGCLEVRYDQQLIIIDAGTGIRPLSYTLQDEKTVHLILSHTHWDHILGFPFFRPLYDKNMHLHIWAPRGEGKPCRELFQTMMSHEFFPISFDQIQAQLTFHTIQHMTPIELGPLQINFHRVHHPGETYSIQIQTPHELIGYTTDDEIVPGKTASFIEFHKDSDYFIHEAQYTEEEYARKARWGHSCLNHVIQIVEQIRPSRWLVTHHDPEHTDQTLRALEKTARSQVKCPVEWVYDGQIFSLK